MRRTMMRRRLTWCRAWLVMIVLLRSTMTAAQAADPRHDVAIDPPPILAQGPPPRGGPPLSSALGPPRGMLRRSGGLGSWWKDSDIVKRLQLSEAQVSRIEQTYLEHRLRLVDLRADLEKQELQLQPLLDADPPDQDRITAQIDAVTAARGRLEKEFALMLLAIRQALSKEQWTQLQTLQREREPRGYPGPGGFPRPPGPPLSPPGFAPPPR
jgi:Spy/CpxP family protein refolding chaperone